MRLVLSSSPRPGRTAHCTEWRQRYTAQAPRAKRRAVPCQCKARVLSSPLITGTRAGQGPPARPLRTGKRRSLSLAGPRQRGDSFPRVSRHSAPRRPPHPCPSHTRKAVYGSLRGDGAHWSTWLVDAASSSARPHARLSVQAAARSLAPRCSCRGCSDTRRLWRRQARRTAACRGLVHPAIRRRSEPSCILVWIEHHLTDATPLIKKKRATILYVGASKRYCDLYFNYCKT